MVPLAVHSHYSLGHGTAPIKGLCRAARALGYTRLALTDTNNLYGLWPFLRACKREGIRPLVGAKITGVGQRPASAVALVQDARGYRNLCRLISLRHSERPGFCLERAVRRHAAGLVLLTAAPQLLRRWHDAGVTVAAALPRKASAAPAGLRRLARELGCPAVATADSFLLNPGDLELHRVLRAMALKLTLARLPAAEVAPADAFLAPPAEYARRFEVAPEALRATEALAERCAFTGPDRTTVLPPWHDAAGRPAAQVLREAAYLGARRRYGDDLSEAVVERLEHELRVIEDKGFCGYFLVVQEIVERSPRICGRGSGAASLVAYCLGITNVCPVKHELYFERFLNPGRMDPPDIDVDFAWDERDAVLAWVLRRHQGHAAMVCNHVLFQPRMAIREVARAHGLGDREISAVVRQLPLVWRDGDPAGHGAQAGPWRQPRLDTSPALAPPWPAILALAQRLVGTPRHLSVHPGGMVVTPGPIQDHAPIEPAVKEVPGQHLEAVRVPCLQWEKDGTEESGLVKIDLLGNRSLAVIRDALAQAAAPDEQRWEPEDDPATQRAVAAGQTMGCFYIESPAMRLLQQRTGVGDFEHLVIHSSIIRPAANEYIREYIRRLRGAAWEPIHPLLAEVLEETLGIMVYQEDVSRAAVALAGMSHAEADGLRKILSKKDREHHLAVFAERFASGARARGVDPASIERVWAMMRSFEGYSFCKPHSASYARVSFQAAYLKVHHPAEFMAAVISNGGGFYSTFAYVSEARRMGLRVCPPCVMRSAEGWRGRGQRVRVGLSAVRALSRRTQQRIIEQRARRPFAGMDDFLARARPDTEEARALIHAGACDRLAGAGEGRTQLLWRQRCRQQTQQIAPGRSGELFAAPAAALPPAPELPPADLLTRLRRQYEVLGFLCDRHPMELYARALAGRAVIKARDLPRHAGRRVRLAGWLITGRLVPTRRGEPMEFLTFEDETGVVESTFFPRAYRRFCHLLDWSRPFVLEGKVEQEFGAATLTVDQVQRLERRSV